MTPIILLMIIERPLLKKRLTQQNAWTLVYGRRKTGKSFLVKNFVTWDDYFFIKRNRTVLYETKTLSYESFAELFKSKIHDKKTVVIDEFHRLPEEFFDYLHHEEKKGRLILISSTLFLAKRFFSAHSPLLGLFAETIIPLPLLQETLAATMPMHLDKKAWLELSVLLREPICVKYITKASVREIIKEILISSKETVPSLVGEIFLEEERTLSSIYEGILRAIATGKVKSGEVSSYLFSRKLIAKDDPSLLQQHITTLVKLGIIRKIQVFNKKRFVYKHASPLVRLYYLADERYNLSEQQLPGDLLDEFLAQNLPLVIEDAVREALAQKLGLIEQVYEDKDFGVDGMLLKLKKLNMVLEVKWRTTIKHEEMRRITENLLAFKAKRHVLFVPDKEKVAVVNCIEVMDPKDLL